MRLSFKSLAGIAYAGTPGCSADCVTAVLQLLFYGKRIKSARILTHEGSHCLLLSVGEDHSVAIKSGFASGYLGEGPQALAFVLKSLMGFGVDIEEYEVPEDCLIRLDASALTHADLESFEKARPVRPARWYGYLLLGSQPNENKNIFADLDPRLPLSIIDSRIMDLAIHFEDDPDGRLMTGYRRLEDLVRARTGLQGEFSTKLFSKTFAGEDSLLCWVGVNGAEQQGRALLFTGTYMAHRNPRAHQEQQHGLSNHISEFLLLNHLFNLEREASSRATAEPALKSELLP